jgi:hypothetical protein
MWSSSTSYLWANRALAIRCLYGIFVASALYFQGRGISQIVASSYVHASPSVEGFEPRAVAEPSTPIKDAKVVLERNPFDALTGSLIEEPPSAEEVEEEPAEAGVSGIDDPRSAPECEGARAYAVTEFDNPRLSLATIQTEDTPHGESVRIGSEVGDFEVAYIGYNAGERSPAVWLVKEDALCQALVFTEKDRFESVVNDRAAKRASAEAKKRAIAKQRAKKRAAARKKKKQAAAKKKRRVRARKRAAARRRARANRSR